MWALIWQKCLNGIRGGCGFSSLTFYLRDRKLHNRTVKMG